MRFSALLLAASLLATPSLALSQGAPCTTGHGPLEPLTAPVLDLSTPEPSIDNLMAWVNLLAGPDANGRGISTTESARLAQSLADHFQQLGLTGAFGAGDYCQLFAVPYMAPDQNVGAWRRAEPDSARPVVLLVAHHDGQGVSYSEPPYYPGADDNASGVAVMMEVARVLGPAASALPLDVMYVSIGGQLNGMTGSMYLAQHPPVPWERVTMLIELDMVGRQVLDGNNIARMLLGNPVDSIGYTTGPLREASSLAIAESVEDATGVNLIGVPDSVAETTGLYSDAQSFSDVVRTITLSTGTTADWHQLTDTPETLDQGQLLRAAGVVLRLIEALAMEPAP